MNKKNKYKFIFLIGILFLLTGCGKSKYILDDKNQAVRYEETGQMLQKDILCLPEEDGDLYNIYKEHKKELNNKFEDLPSCQNFKVNSNKSTGLWEFLFVKPLAWLILSLGKLVNNLGISLIIIGLLIRIILLPLTIKSGKQTINMQKAQPEIEKIEKKYRNRTDNDALMAKSQETMLVYNKYKVNPMLGCLLSFIQLPLFFAFLQAVERVPAIYEEKLFGFNLGTSPLKGIQNGNYLYIILILLIIIATYFSFKQTLNNTPQSNEEAAKQMKIMVYVMLFVISYASLTLPTALAFYWIITYAFIAIQNIIINPKKKKKNKSSKKTIKDKLAKKEGLKYGKNS